MNANQTQPPVAEREHVIRYVVTHINKDGMRTLCGPAQGRHTRATPEEAQSFLDAMLKNNRMENGLLAGVYGLPLEVRPVKCYPGHFDPMGIYFEATTESSAAGAQEHVLPGEVDDGANARPRESSPGG